jgi:hypothetical protein
MASSTSGQYMKAPVKEIPSKNKVSTGGHSAGR